MTTDKALSEENNWSYEVLQLKKYADFLTKYLTIKTNEPFVLNINVPWERDKLSLSNAGMRI